MPYYKFGRTSYLISLLFLHSFFAVVEAVAGAAILVAALLLK
jgi:hypothetical protein